MYYDYWKDLLPMSEEQLKAFLEKVKGDTSLQEKLEAAASPEAAIEIAKAAGFAITVEDIQSMQLPVDLSDDELEGLAGGKFNRASNPLLLLQNADRISSYSST